MNRGVRVRVTDNSGALEAKIFGSYNAFKKLHYQVGDIVMVAIKRSIPTAKVKSGSKSKAVIVRTKNVIRRKDGSMVQFYDNAVVLLNAKHEPVGTSVFGPVAMELAFSHLKGVKEILSMAKGGIS